MIKHWLLAAAAVLLTAGCSPSPGPDANAEKGVPAAAAAPAPAKAEQTSGGMPAEIRFTSAVGEVVFQHQKHITERSLPCVQCHHQINAKKLDTPHPEYFKSSQVNCQVCHDDKNKAVYSCSECHRSQPRNIADETLSAKVVIHQQCGKCHNVGTGKEASERCEFCHTRTKADVAGSVQPGNGKN